MPTNNRSDQRTRVTVISLTAILAGHETVTWTGDMFLPDVDADTVNEYLFAMFNGAGIQLVTEHLPALNLREIGYRLPSLSLGDLVHWDAVTYRVSSTGFEVVTGNADLAWRALGA